MRFRIEPRDVPPEVAARRLGKTFAEFNAALATASFTLHRSIFWCVLLQVIMTIADTPAPKEAITAALLVIGDKILSGRTTDQNIGYVAEYLTALGMHLVEVRVIGDEETAIVDAVNALRHRYTYVFTTGGIGPTHDDITADSVAKALGVPIDSDPRALAILREWLKVTGAEMNEARLRMTRIPKGADLILNKVSGAPGFWIGNVIVMAGAPSIMQAMLDEVSRKLETGVRMLSETVRADTREGDIGTQLGEIARANPEDPEPLTEPYWTDWAKIVTWDQKLDGPLHARRWRSRTKR